MTNTPNKIIDTTTTPNTNSDHSYITTTYLTNEPMYTPKFIEIRDKKLLTHNNLKLCIDLNTNLKKILQLQLPDDIANNLQLELSTIIDTIAPPKIVQFRKDFQPYLNQELPQPQQPRLCKFPPSSPFHSC